MSDYNEIKKELKRIKNRTIAPNNSSIKKKLAHLKEKNFEQYENLMLHYVNILEELVVSDKEDVINMLLEKVSKYGEKSLTEEERKKLEYYSTTL